MAVARHDSESEAALDVAMADVTGVENSKGGDRCGSGFWTVPEPLVCIRAYRSLKLQPFPASAVFALCG